MADWDSGDDDSRMGGMLDQENALGGGGSSWGFSSFRGLDRGTGLPPPPAAYEDFEYPTSIPDFDYDFFPGSSSSNPFSFANPFSPGAPSPAYPSAHAHTPPYPAPRSPAPVPSTSHLAAPALALFDESESALFSSFLNTIDVDQNFLFNPVLPPGMPSPPPSIMPREEDRREREWLGNEVGSMSLRRGGQEERERVEKRWVKEEEVDDGFEWRQGPKTRGAVGDGGSGRGKKAKVEEEEDPEEHDEQDEDYEMGTEDDSTATATTATAGRRRVARSTTSTARSTARRSSTARSFVPSSARAAGPSSSRPQPRPRSPSPTGSSSSGRDGTPAAVDKKVPLTDSQKRNNHILSEQKRRNAIRSGFKDLVDLLTAGEETSGIVVAPPEVEHEEGKKKKSKGSGRGRGRKGEVGAGASKSVVLEKAAAYIMWLERGNDVLEQEVTRVERLLASTTVRS